MPTVTDLRTAAAALLQRPAADFVINGVDLLLLGINSAKRQAQLEYDFEMCRVPAQVTLTAGVGSFAQIKDSTGAALLPTKKIEAAYLGTRPIDFVGRSTQNAASDRAYSDYDWAPGGGTPTPDVVRGPTLVQQGDRLTLLAAPSAPTVVALDVVSILPDYLAVQRVLINGVANPGGVNGTYPEVGTYLGHKLWMQSNPTPTYAVWNDLTQWIISLASDMRQPLVNYFSFASTADSPVGLYVPHGTWTASVPTATNPVVALDPVAVGNDFFLTQGFDYLLWKTVCDYNYLWSEFVPREEGTLPPPTTIRDDAWKTLLAWDSGLVNTGSTSYTLD